jgi:hypothetical protein
MPTMKTHTEPMESTQKKQPRNSKTSATVVRKGSTAVRAMTWGKMDSFIEKQVKRDSKLLKALAKV